MNKEEKIAILQDVIRIKSVNDHETEVANYFKDLLAKHGIDSEIVEYEGNRSNLVAELKGNEDGKVLAISGHMDVVAAGDESEWIYPPFDAVIEDGKMYGRGTTDMKAGTTALVLAMIELKESGRPFNGKIKLLATFGEEIGTLGAKQLTELGYADDLDGLLIAEPSGAKSLISAHKGSISYKVVSKGKAAHSSMPQEGINAIEQLNIFMSKIGPAMAEVIDQYESEKLGRTTHAITLISGGTQVNSIPESAVLEGNIRSIAEFDNAKIHDLFNNIISEINEEIDGKLELTFTQNNFPVDMPEDSDLIQAAKKVVGDLPIVGLSATTDGAQFSQADKTFDFLIFGPGEPTLPHQVNEFVKVDEYIEFIDIFQDIIVEYLA